MTYQTGQRVRVRHLDALGRTQTFDGAIVRREPDIERKSLWRVDIGGIAVVFFETDIQPMEDTNERPGDPAAVPAVQTGGSQTGTAGPGEADPQAHPRSEISGT